MSIKEKIFGYKTMYYLLNYKLNQARYNIINKLFYTDLLFYCGSIFELLLLRFLLLLNLIKNI
jgi:hypothetical protein